MPRERYREGQVWDSQAGTELRGYSQWQGGSVSGQTGLPGASYLMVRKNLASLMVGLVALRPWEKLPFR